MTEDTFVQIVWCGLIVFGFLGLLVVPAAIIESRFGREWLRRLKEVEIGRAHQRAEHIERSAFYSRERGQ